MITATSYGPLSAEGRALGTAEATRREVEPSCAWNALERRGGKLTDHGDGRYTVQVHSNCWYELRRAS